MPCVLSIGGLDPGGGAGILADARGITQAGAFACAAVAVLTVQSTSGLRAATPVPKSELIAECNEVLKHQRVRAIKVGALGSDENARAIGDFLAIHRDIPAVVDAVMMPTRGRARLLDERAVGVLRDRVLGRAALVTVNAPEAEVLTGTRVTRLDEAHDAAHALLRQGCRAVLVKGGHLTGPHAVDLLAIAAPETGPRIIELTSPRLRLAPLHGGGCVLASLVAGRLAVHADDYAADPVRALSDALRWSKKTHHEALNRAADIGGDLKVLFA
ncbi:MAG: bifunctional hydroxymethylpyrimidine kinase/phosphomethylpyrimidine kinase [Labilithrix sp.]|nr:bifunctional hydroxymethylpyrimidine kinase/phosphomethylpyrimidine kinase [Labilithrix sp.]